MPFFKSLILAIIATLFLTYIFGSGLIEMFNVDIHMGEEVIHPIIHQMEAISFSALIVILVVIIVTTIIMSVFGAIIFIAMLVFGTIAVMALGLSWPVLLVAVFIWLLCRDKRSNNARTY